MGEERASAHVVQTVEVSSGVKDCWLARTHAENNRYRRRIQFVEQVQANFSSPSLCSLMLRINPHSA